MRNASFAVRYVSCCPLCFSSKCKPRAGWRETLGQLLSPSDTILFVSLFADFRLAGILNSLSTLVEYQVVLIWFVLEMSDSHAMTHTGVTVLPVKFKVSGSVPCTPGRQQRRQQVSAKTLPPLLSAQEAPSPRPRCSGCGGHSGLPQCCPLCSAWGEVSLEQVPSEDRQWHAPSTASKQQASQRIKDICDK